MEKAQFDKAPSNEAQSDKAENQDPTIGTWTIILLSAFLGAHGDDARVWVLYLVVIIVVLANRKQPPAPGRPISRSKYLLRVVSIALGAYVPVSKGLGCVRIHKACYSAEWSNWACTDAIMYTLALAGLSITLGIKLTNLLGKHDKMGLDVAALTCSKGYQSSGIVQRVINGSQADKAQVSAR